MKNAIKRFQNRIIAFIIGILGFSAACDKIVNPEPLVEYGIPYATFKISGTVVNDSLRSAIPGILVIMNDTSFTSGDSCLTDKNGEFSVQLNEFASSQTFEVSFKDVNVQMSGYFLSKDTIVTFQNPQFSQTNGSWNEGTVSDHFIIALIPKY